MCELCDREPADYETPTHVARELGKLLTWNDHWGPFHIVVEDCNVEDCHVASCYKQIETLHDLMVYTLFSMLTEEQRLTALALHEGILS